MSDVAPAGDSEVRFGAYRVEGTLGRGALATIYKAVQPSTARVVALKALKTQIAASSSFGEQLEREAKVLADLAHPNVILLVDYGRSEAGRPYLVLEHVDGPTLQQVLAKKKRLTIEAALAVACAMCAALEHVHERGVVHRDVKPSNVLLSRAGVVKLIDFGIAQRTRTASISDTLGTEGITPSGRMAPEPMKDAFGTPAYMSPEQILGDFVDLRSDLFSLGVVLYQLLERGAVDVLEDEVRAAGAGPVGLEEEHDVGVREIGEDLGLAIELLAEGGRRRDLGLQRLQRDDATERLLHRSVDRREGAGADRAGDPVPVEPGLAHVFGTKIDLPVIAAGAGMPISSSIVGATSQIRPPGRSARSRSASLT